MAVTNAETFVISGDAVSVNSVNVLAALAAEGVTATASGSKATCSTNTQITQQTLGAILRLCDSQGMKFTYTPAS